MDDHKLGAKAPMTPARRLGEVTMTTDVSKWLDDVQARVDAATAGPWEVAIHKPQWTLRSPSQHCRIASERFDPECLPETHERQRNDAEFIANARTDIPRLLAALRAVVEECKYAMSGRDAWSSCRGDGHTALGENVIDAIEREIGIPCPPADDVSK